MAFVTDPATLNVVDRERELALHATTGGSDGRLGKKLVGPNFECTFDAYRTMRDATMIERAARPEIDKTIVWELRNAGPPIPGLSLHETYELLAEALLAQRFSDRHDEVNWAIRLPTACIEGNRHEL